MSFTLNFKPDHPALKSPEFEERLALRLLDIFYGRDGGCVPDPVPLKTAGGDTRMIGSGNDTWLRRVDAASYTVSTRYKTPETDEAMASAEKLIRQQYENMIRPDTPAAPISSGGLPVTAPETIDVTLATAMKPVKTVSFRRVPKVTAP